jgi:hypothetical protein
MSMICYLRVTTDDEIADLLAQAIWIIDKLKATPEFEELDGVIIYMV